MRFQFSMRTLLLATAAVALLLVPVAWVARERQEMMRARQAILQAREVALRSVVREQEKRLIDSAWQNADLKEQVQQLRRQVEQLRRSNGPGGSIQR
jgi:hypothetical protein